MNPRVYFNLHKKVFSVQEKVGPSWKVARHTESFFFKNPEYRVSQAGRERVLRQKRKNVHAYVTGEEICALPDNVESLGFLRYNPFLYSFFFSENGEEVLRDEFVKMTVEDGKPKMERYTRIL